MRDIVINYVYYIFSFLPDQSQAEREVLGFQYYSFLPLELLPHIHFWPRSAEMPSLSAIRTNDCHLGLFGEDRLTVSHRHTPMELDLPGEEGYAFGIGKLL